ncbi:MAG: hypothetical protein J0I77_11355 [Rudaea sp.]|uniref:hypothetical protein n=1 Tax=unclassified Rudaea TaxID=2627037 RepID=UPI0010FA416F|nr:MULTISPECIES: hypothetical protein [unclassified Rudaea]MBN8886307.1 hypothetical protein [Rudaea sp.]MBR0345909.1 hypothetical protein [Rudaea sp.]
MDTNDLPPARSRRIRASDIGSFAALALSVLALATGAYQTRLMQAQTELMQTQSRASVWPYVTVGKNEDAIAGHETFVWRVDNNGVGPAKIQSVEVKLDGKPYRNWKELFAVLAPEQEFHAQTSSLNGLVLPPSLNRETTIEMVKPDTAERAKVFLTAQQRISIEVCYCSVYDECWIAQSLKPGNTSVPRCERAGKLQFED